MVSSWFLHFPCLYPNNHLKVSLWQKQRATRMAQFCRFVGSSPLMIVHTLHLLSIVRKKHKSWIQNERKRDSYLCTTPKWCEKEFMVFSFCLLATNRPNEHLQIFIGSAFAKILAFSSCTIIIIIADCQQGSRNAIKDMKLSLSSWLISFFLNLLSAT